MVNPRPAHSEPRAALRSPRHVAAVLIPIAIFVISALGIAALTDVPVASDVERGQGVSRAAIAIRDDVIPFQKFGTRIFTEPLLERGYDEVHYFTERAWGQQHGPFVDALRGALSRHSRVDVFLLAHSNSYLSWVQEIEPDLRARIRLVYNTGCQDARQSQGWIEAGADTYVGHPGLSASPVFYFYFLRRWARGQPLEVARAASNARMRILLDRIAPLSMGVLDAEVIFKDSEAMHFGREELDIAAP